MEIKIGVESSHTFWTAVVRWKYSSYIFAFETQFSNSMR